jgi:hypothetical protein
MKKIAPKLIMIASMLAVLTASKCDDNDYSSDDPSSVADYIFDKGCDYLYDNRDVAEENLKEMDECRLECVLHQSSCDIMDQCLWWNIGYDGKVDDYCKDDDDGDDDDDSYTNLEACVAAECPSQAAACQANTECTGIFENCYPGCADLNCVAVCAQDNYPNGISDHDVLYSCMASECSTYMQ